MSLPIRGAWIEIRETFGGADDLESLPIRGAWIEIHTFLRVSANVSRRSPSGERGLKSSCRYENVINKVAPHPGSVD